jgi:hypothetical protein
MEQERMPVSAPEKKPDRHKKNTTKRDRINISM